jgi:hypothetical protein
VRALDLAVLRARIDPLELDRLGLAALVTVHADDHVVA